jgi:uncharacterized phage protein (TIGR02218 family)
MAFNDYETSVESSVPVELFEFSYQGGTIRATSADRNITYLSHIYQGLALQRSPIKETVDIAKATLNITAPADFSVAELFNPAPPDDVVGLVVRRLQYTDNSAEAFWFGRVMSAGWQKGYSQLRCESIFTSMKQLGLRRIYSKNCPHVLYGARCRASEATFQQAISVEGVAGRSIQSAGFDAFDDGWFSGGKIVWESSPGYYVRRGIKIHTGDEVFVTHPIPGLTPGTVITVLPGCNHTIAHCGPKFSNNLNYGGMPYMDGQNAFTTSVY